MSGFGRSLSAVPWAELCAAHWHMTHCAVPTESDAPCNEGSSTVGLHSLKPRFISHGIGTSISPRLPCRLETGNEAGNAHTRDCTAAPRPSQPHTWGHLTGESLLQLALLKDRCEQ